MIIREADRLNSVKEYYFSTKLKQIQKMREEGNDVLNLGIGNPDLKPSEQTIAELKNTASQDGVHGYQSYIGIPELRQAISDWLKNTYGLSLDPISEVLPLIGSKEGIMHISMAFLNENDKVLVPNPGYPAYAAVAKLVNAEIITYDLQETSNWAPDLRRIERLDVGEVKIMWLNYPNMPTGANLDPAIVKRLITLAKEKRFLIVNDNPYSMILNDHPSSLLEIEGAKEVIIELNSLSKSHNMAGWRLGWVAGNKDYLQSILKVKSNVDSGMFLPIQKAAVKALSSGKEWFDSVNNIYRKRRGYVWKIMDELGCSYNKQQTGMFIWAKIPEQYDRVDTLTDELLEKSHVFITPGLIFGSGGDRYVRISLCNTEKTLNEALTRVRAFVNSKKLISQQN